MSEHCLALSFIIRRVLLLEISYSYFLAKIVLLKYTGSLPDHYKPTSKLQFLLHLSAWGFQGFFNTNIYIYHYWHLILRQAAFHQNWVDLNVLRS